MTEYVDLTWIDSLSQLRSYQRIQQEHMTGLDKGIIKINEKLLKTLEDDLINNISDARVQAHQKLGIKTILGFVIYEEEDTWSIASESDERLNNQKVWNDIKTLKKKISEDITKYFSKDFGLVDNNPIININTNRKMQDIIIERFGF